MVVVAVDVLAVILAILAEARLRVRATRLLVGAVTQTVAVVAGRRVCGGARRASERDEQREQDDEEDEEGTR